MLLAMLPYGKQLAMVGKRCVVLCCNSGCGAVRCTAQCFAGAATILRFFPTKQWPCPADAAPDWHHSRHEQPGATPSPVAAQQRLASPTLPLPSSSLQRLTGTIPDMSSLAQLQALQLQNNGLSGGLPPMPEAMRNLNLEYNRITWVFSRLDSRLGCW